LVFSELGVSTCDLKIILKDDRRFVLLEGKNLPLLDLWEILKHSY
jgi:hypothetical protein